MSTSMKIPNQLINETSPYLLQHADNPVNWYPWKQEAFDRAKAEDKPIFLSIGYSTCHWCHVMAHESFEDAEVAHLLNEHFISIKVDREERPDIDHVYMSVCQALTGSGGWPLTVFLTPDKKPFFAGTYFPKNSMYGRIGLVELLSNVVKQWETNQELLLNSSEDITQKVSDWSKAGATAEAYGGTEVIELAVKQFIHSFDTQYGGFGPAPKFPTPHNLLFLMRYCVFAQNNQALEMVEKTLLGMYKGGIFDHIGYGFSRYSTDREWLAPHFEKMLYDNALMVIALLECFQLTKKDMFKDVAEKTLTYIAREMTHPQGGFYSAQDADSEGVEGKFYTFTPQEIIDTLGQDEASIFCKHFDITENGNFEDVNIPNLIKNTQAITNPYENEAAIKKLYDFRLRRTSLHKDDKILTAWNALMIAALSKAYRVTGKACYLETALKAYTFIQDNLVDEAGLKISWRDGKATGSGLLDDYAFFTYCSLELYASTLDVRYLAQAIALAKETQTRFADEDGGFFLSPSHAEALIFRPKETYDGAMPSGNAVFAACLTQLAVLTGDSLWIEGADSQLEFLSSAFSQMPQVHTFGLMALMKKVYPTQELVCVVKNKEDLPRMIKTLHRRFLPGLAVIAKTPGNQAELDRLCPFTKDYPIPKNTEAAFYLCQNQSCAAAVYNLEEVLDKV